MASLALRSLIPSVIRSSSLVLDRYYSDGRRLLRVIDTGAATPYISLEDCLTLEVRRYSPGEIIKLRLRPITPARLDDAEQTRRRARLATGAEPGLEPDGCDRSEDQRRGGQVGSGRP